MFSQDQRDPSFEFLTVADDFQFLASALKANCWASWKICPWLNSWPFAITRLSSTPSPSLACKRVNSIFMVKRFLDIRSVFFKVSIHWPLPTDF